jgi:phosphohistidine phosphatase
MCLFVYVFSGFFVVELLRLGSFGLKAAGTRISSTDMRLYFMRHADALDGIDDTARPLSPRGWKQAKEVARFLKTAGIRFDAAYSSPLVRARETAEAVLTICGAVEPDDLKLEAALRNEASARQFAGWLRNLPEARHVLLVGHAPSLAEHVRALLSMGDPEALELSKGGLACLETEDGRTAVLKLLLTPKLLGV